MQECTFPTSNVRVATYTHRPEVGVADFYEVGRMEEGTWVTSWRVHGLKAAQSLVVHLLRVGA